MVSKIGPGGDKELPKVGQTNSIKDAIEEKTTSIINSPIAKKITHTTIADITPTINKIPPIQLDEA